MEQKKQFRLQNIQYRNNSAYHQHNRGRTHNGSQPHFNRNNDRIKSRKRRFKHIQPDEYPHNFNNNANFNEHQHPSKRARYNNSYPHQNNYQSNNYKFREQKNTKFKKKEMEQDFHRITQRMRQVDIGKATPEYKNYISVIAKDERQSYHPQTPNPKHKMPNKWWKTAINRWRKALHAFDVIDHPNSHEKSPQKDKENIDTNPQNFCCEKCCQEFPKFDEWEKHREICEGKPDKIKKDEQMEKVINDKETDDDDDFDLFNIDEDIDLNFMESAKNNKTEEAKEECSLLMMSINNLLNDDDDDGLL